jgi:hypothetical protein
MARRGIKLKRLMYSVKKYWKEVREVIIITLNF